MKNNRKMTQTDIDRIVLELKRWEVGELGTRLTWHRLEESFGFSRVAMSIKPGIKVAYEKAKKSLRGGQVKTRQQQADIISWLQDEVSQLRGELAEYKRREKMWLKKWQRIAYHLKFKGLGSMRDFDRPIPEGEKVPTQKESKKILESVDQPMIPVNRR